MSRPINKIAFTAAAALALPLFAAVSVAHATPIQQWEYTVHSGFDGWTEVDGNGSGVQGSDPNADFGDRPATLSWSDTTGLASSIGVTGTVTGSDLHTNGGYVGGATFSHHNTAIDADAATLATANVLSRLTLTPITPPGSEGYSPDPLNFGISFKETFNDPAGNCGFDSVSNCDDIFILTSPSGLIAQTFQPGDGYEYTVHFSINDLVDPLDPDICAEAGVAPGCRGITTLENQNNSFNTSFAITSAALAVPEPGTLSILALGLLCLAGAGFSRKWRMG